MDSFDFILLAPHHWTLDVVDMQFFVFINYQSIMKVGKWFFLKKNCIWKHGVTYENNFGKDKEKKTNKRWWKNKGRNEDHNYFLMQTYSIICKVQASLFAILWNWWGKECVKANRERCDCCCWPRFRVWSGIFKKAFLVHMRVCSLPPIIHIHPKELVLPKFQKPSFSTWRS